MVFQSDPRLARMKQRENAFIDHMVAAAAMIVYFALVVLFLPSSEYGRALGTGVVTFAVVFFVARKFGSRIRSGLGPRLYFGCQHFRQWVVALTERPPLASSGFKPLFCCGQHCGGKAPAKNSHTSRFAPRSVLDSLSPWVSAQSRQFRFF